MRFAFLAAPAALLLTLGFACGGEAEDGVFAGGSTGTLAGSGGAGAGSPAGSGAGSPTGAGAGATTGSEGAGAGATTGSEGAGAGATTGSEGAGAGATTGSEGAGAGATTGSTTGSATGATTGSGASGPCGTTQCSDCMDNDGDGEVDGFDTECIGPLDDDESSFATGIPGDNIDACKQDCFFDGNSGQGDDGCNWELKCDPQNPGAPKCPYDPSYKNCPTKQSQKCIDFCLGLTPNGCDCFGCCDVTLDNQSKVTILIGSNGCTEEKANDPSVCKPCTKTSTCVNECETCEYCLGKDTLPPECSQGGTGGGSASSGATSGSGGSTSSGSGGSGGGTNNCQDGQTACSPTAPCPGGFYCLTGCCIPVPN